MDVPSFPWVPKPTQFMMKSLVGGDDLETASFLGTYFAKSILPISMDRKPDPHFLD